MPLPHAILAIETSGRLGSIALAAGGRIDLVRLSHERRTTADLVPAVRDLLARHGLTPRPDSLAVAYSEGPGSFTGLRVAATFVRMLVATTGCPAVAVPTLEVIARAAAAPAGPDAVSADAPADTPLESASCDAPPADAPAPPAPPAELIVPILDARRGLVYGAIFAARRPAAAHSAGDRESAGAELRPVRPTGLYEPASLLAAAIEHAGDPARVVATGSGLERHAELFAQAGVRLAPQNAWPASAEHVIPIARRLLAAGQLRPAARIVPAYVRPPECEEVYDARRAAAREKRGE